MEDAVDKATHVHSSQGWFLPSIDGRNLEMASLYTQRIIINFVNLVFLLVFLLGLLVARFRRQNDSRNRSRQCGFVIISACCAVAGMAYFILAVSDFVKQGQFISWELTDYFASGLTWITLSFSLSIHSADRIDVISVLWWFTFSFLMSVYNLQVILQNHRFGSLEILDLVSWPMNFLLLYCTFQILIKRYSNRDQSKDILVQPLLAEEGSKNTVERKAGFVSCLTFSWLNSLIRLGHSRPLKLKDIPALDAEDQAIQAYMKFIHVWDLQQQEKSRGSHFVSLALAKCYLTEILLTGFYSLLKTIAISSAPLILYAFVQYSDLSDKDLTTGFALVGCLILVKLVESLSQRHWFFDSRRLGMRMRSALMASIFQKQLKLSIHGRKKHSAGEIVNYIAVDAYRLGDFPAWFHLAWCMPLQMLIALAITIWVVGRGALPGLVPLAICAVINIPFAKLLQGYQAKFMVAQDERQRATSEALNSMKIIKLQSWEEQFRSMIENLRNAEAVWLSEIQLKKAYGTALYWMAPTVVSAVIFAGTAWMQSAPLNASTVFTVLATLRVMSEPVRMIPESLSMMIQVKVSLDRIGVFLLEDEINEGDSKRCPRKNSDLSIRVESGFFSWESDKSSMALRNINLKFYWRQKVAICGPVGSGKTSLLYAILGELPKSSGSVEVFGSIAYVSQISWIQSGTIRDNILYGKPMDKALYEKAIKSCALDKDIDHFDHGDLTEIGQRGLNMSGGQKQRIQLARAVYNDADIYLLDDPFSAVDAHTAATLFHDCIMGALKEKTVILVTHQVEFLNEADRILVMENGQVTQEGTYEELLEIGTAFEQLVNAHRSSLDTINSLNHGIESQAEYDSGTRVESIGSPLRKQQSEHEILTKGFSAQLTEDEETEIGDLGLRLYLDYFKVSNGYFLLSLIIMGQAAFVLLQSLATYWLAIAIQLPHITSVLLVGVYAGCSIMSCVFAYLRSFFAALLGLKASKAFFTSFLNSVFKAPMLFFDSTPVGRILTRVSSDLSVLDFDIPYSITFMLTASIEIVAVIIIMAYVTWQVLIIAIPIMIIIVLVQKYYVATARELVRINGTTKAPVMNYASESLQGVVTIRAFETTERFFYTNLSLIDTDASLFYYTIGTLEWVLLRVETLQNLTIFTSALLLVFLPQGVIAAGMSGLSLTYALTLSASQNFLTRFYSYLENYIISVERLKQFMHIPPEPPAVISERRPPPTWPSAGEIELEDLKVKYRPNAPLVLKGITCTFKAGYKVGVVGRTGSGKTTLISALFRLVDPAGGRILIDKIDICSIGLKDLRTKLSIIPQEPTLFRGSVRTNMDPLGLHTDQEIWEALDKCQLKSTISNLPSLLDSSVTEDGQNWSAGQRQLFCLGRVLLRRNKILVLDEATASIDSATDVILQRIIKQEFSNCTVLTIAHRVPTVTDSDIVMVLSYGKLVEFDKPSNLLSRSTSAFTKLVAEYWSDCKRDSSVPFYATDGLTSIK